MIRPRSIFIVAAALTLGVCGFAGAQTPLTSPSVVIFRVFLKDGRALASYGEYAHVGDRLIFTVPVGDIGIASLPLISLPVSSVDLERTEKYTESVRAAQFSAARGPQEYDALTTEVSKAVDGISHTQDAAVRLAMAEDGRAKLVTWAAQSHGYRSKDVQQLTQMLDEIIQQLRASAGGAQFSLALVAGTPDANSEPLLPPPSLRESIELALEAASAADSGVDRISVLRAALRATNTLFSGPAPGDANLNARIERTLAEETAAEHAYSNLLNATETQAVTAVRKGDVRTIRTLQRQLIERDQALGSRRPNEIADALAMLDDRLKAAQVQRLALDHWDAVHDSIEAYRRRAVDALNDVAAITPLLDNIRDMAGTEASRLSAAERKLTNLSVTFGQLTPPVDVRLAHTLISTAVQLARQACSLRRRAVVVNDIALARDASAAAAGSQLLLLRAREELAARTRPPQ